MNKSGQLNLIIIISIVAMITIVGVVLYLFGNLYGDLFNSVSESDTFDAPEAISFNNQISSDVVPMFDNIIFWVYMAFMIGIIFFAIYSDFHPAWVIVGIIFLLIGIYLAMQSVNIFDTIKTDSDLEYSSGFTLTNIIFSPFLPISLIAFLVISLIILYGKRRDSGGY